MRGGFVLVCVCVLCYCVCGVNCLVFCRGDFDCFGWDFVGWLIECVFDGVDC